MTPVTKPWLPPLEELLPRLESIWASGVLSNGGALHQEFEAQLTAFLNLDAVSVFNNATSALMVAQRALNVTGEVITTPYTFAATAHSIDWMGNTPVFVDIDAESLCIDSALIENAITENTTAIMPLHCYGNMCDVDAIRAIADEYDLRVIYDACHSFGVNDDGGSALRHGDIAVVSFHATKVFNTFEGGALFSRDPDIKLKVDRLKNFGFVDEVTVEGTGINGKMSEFNAAVGLLQLEYFEYVTRERAHRDQLYRERLEGTQGLEVVTPVGQVKRNYAYFPVLVTPDYPESRDALYQRLIQHDIYGRRYFYPLVPEFPKYRSTHHKECDRFPVASAISRQVICLPLYPDLPVDEIERICDVIARCGS